MIPPSSVAGSSSAGSRRRSQRPKPQYSTLLGSHPSPLQRSHRGCSTLPQTMPPARMKSLLEEETIRFHLRIGEGTEDVRLCFKTSPPTMPCVTLIVSFLFQSSACSPSSASPTRPVRHQTCRTGLATARKRKI